MRISYLCVGVGIYKASSSILYYIFREWKSILHFVGSSNFAPEGIIESIFRN